MKKKNLLLIVFMILISLVTFNKNVRAEKYPGSAFSGNSGNSAACTSSLDWCYSDIGVRISVYHYNGDKLDYIISKDFETDYSSYYPKEKKLHERTARVSLEGAGKIAYLYDKDTKMRWSDSDQYYKIQISDKIKFPCFYESKCTGGAEAIKDRLFTYFGLKNVSDLNANTVAKKINNFFGISISANEVVDTYVTIEPTIYIYDKNKASLYGTIYELLNTNYTKQGKSMYGLNGQIYNHFPITMVASIPSTPDNNNFISLNSNDSLIKALKSSAKLSYGYSTVLNGKSDYDDERLANRNQIVSKEGWGIGVIWVGENITTCKKTCKNKSGDSLLSCAEEYCSNDPDSNKNYGKKATCIKNCGYQKPTPKKCSSYAAPSPTKTNCKQNVTSSVNECKRNGYTLTTCMDRTQVRYSGDLPKNFGINAMVQYSLVTYGRKECTLTIDYNSAKYDYAIQTGPEGRKAVLENLLDSKKLNSLKRDDYKYNIDFNKTIMKIGSNNYNLVVVGKPTVYEVSLDSSSTVDINLYAGGKKAVKTAIKNAKFSSTSSSSFKLDGGYQASKVGTTNTTINMVKESSGLNDTNTCNFNVLKDSVKYGCKITTNATTSSQGTYPSDITAKYTTYYKIKKSGESTYNNATPPTGTKYVFNVQGNTYYNSSKTVTVNKAKGDTKLTGSITVNGVTETCDLDVKFDKKCAINIIDDGNKIIIKLNSVGTVKYDDKDGDEQVLTGKSEYSVLKKDLEEHATTTFKATVNSVNCSATYKYNPDACQLSIEETTNKIIVAFGNSAIGTIKIKELHTGESGWGSWGECTNVNKCEVNKKSIYYNLIATGILSNGNTCNKSLNNIEKCTEKFKPAERESITNYCNNYYQYDLNGYSSPNDCINKCASQCDITEADEWKKNYCADWNSLGFKNEEVCLDSCYNDGNPKKFVYRPIKLGKDSLSLSNPYNAFPDRSAGSNWKGHETRTIENVITKVGAKPIYVIALNKENIINLRNDKNTKKIKIQTNPEIFTCRNGVGSGCN